MSYNFDTLKSDLIYKKLYMDEREEIIKSFPSATFHETYDDIHEHRTEIKFTANEKDWYLYLIEHGLHDLSLSFNFVILDDPKAIRSILNK